MTANKNSNDGHDSWPFGDLAELLRHLADALEAHNSGLGQPGDTRYTRPTEDHDQLVDEATMAAKLGISRRTLAQHRRHGRLPGCWVRNGRKVLWLFEETMETWRRGIA